MKKVPVKVKKAAVQRKIAKKVAQSAVAVSRKHDQPKSKKVAMFKTPGGSTMPLSMAKDLHSAMVKVAKVYNAPKKTIKKLESVKPRYVAPGRVIKVQKRKEMVKTLESLKKYNVKEMPLQAQNAIKSAIRSLESAKSILANKYWKGC
jgi:hypothetical protein